MPRLIATRRNPWPTTRFRICPASWPSAMRMPISFVRWLTEYEMTP